jgi:hypothetical protein
MKSILFLALFLLSYTMFATSFTRYLEHRDLFDVGYKFMLTFIFGILFFMAKEK